ncbi:DUF3311 domain-containing protein [Actinoplanes sp. NPDC049599]|uniref:DUF3311 domain-containing protein n=1 Tax=Actinoplanes sp. NPDC049599 TaxID=3363903 RepID=UPI0037975C06
MTANRYRPPAWPPPSAYPPPQTYRPGPTPPPAYRRPAPQHGTGEWQTIRDRTAPRRPARVRRADASPWNWLLLVPIVLPLIPGLYNRIEPTVFGIPFFYWGQLSFAFLASGVLTFLHLKVR